MKISVVIAAYNSQETIARAIDSVLAQTRPADEMIVIDDGSTDRTAGIVRSYGDKVILIQQTNAGVSVARNTGIAAATGEWIAFLDADDEWLPEKLKLQTEHLRRNPDLKWTFANLLWDRNEYGCFEIAHPTACLTAKQPRDEIFEDYLQAYTNGFFASTITLLIERTVFQKVGLFEPGMKRAQDNDLWFRIAYQYPKIGYLSQPLAIYHLDTPNSSTKISDNVDFMINLVHRHETLSQTYNRRDAFRPCITHMLQIWIRQLMSQKRCTDADALLSRFSGCLSRRFQREMRFRLFCPPLMNPLADAVIRLKNRIRCSKTDG